MDEKNQIVYNYLDRIFRNGNKQADVKIAQQDPKRCKVSVIKENDEFILNFEDENFISPFDGQKKFPINLNHFELSETNMSYLCTCYAGNHIEIKWITSKN